MLILTTQQHHIPSGIPVCVRSSQVYNFACSEALDKDGVLAGIESLSAGDIASLSQWTELDHALTVPEPLSDHTTEVNKALVYPF